MAQPSIEIDGAAVAQALGLEVAAFRQQFDNGKITVLCERGTGEDAGRYRASFYLGDRRARFLVEPDGRLVPA